jgi:hypothetical protein
MSILSPSSAFRRIRELTQEPSGALSVSAR